MLHVKKSLVNKLKFDAVTRILSINSKKFVNHWYFLLLISKNFKWLTNFLLFIDKILVTALNFSLLTKLFFSVWNCRHPKLSFDFERNKREILEWQYFCQFGQFSCHFLHALYITKNWCKSVFKCSVAKFK